MNPAPLAPSPVPAAGGRVPPMADIRLGAGIAHLLVSVAAFAFMNALVKWAVEIYPFGQAVFLRSAVALLPILLLARHQGGAAVLRTSRPAAIATLSVLMVASMVLSFWSYHLLPFADATAYTYVGPLMIAALSAPILAERVGARRWMAVIIGFAGVLLIAPPGTGLLDAGALAGLGSTLLYALGMVLTRKTSGSEHPTCVVFYFTALATLVTACWLPLGWVAPDAIGWLVLGGAGLAGAVGQYSQTQAFRLMPPALAGALSYSRIVLAIALGYAVWGEVPTPAALAGSAIIIASGLYLILAEKAAPRRAGR